MKCKNKSVNCLLLFNDFKSTVLIELLSLKYFQIWQLNIDLNLSAYFSFDTNNGNVIFGHIIFNSDQHNQMHTHNGV